MNQPGPSGRNLFDVFEVDGYSDASDDQSDIELDLEEQSNDEEDCSGGEGGGIVPRSRSSTQDFDQPLEK